MDKAPGHPKALMEMYNEINGVFIPANTASTLQPMDQEVTPVFLPGEPQGRGSLVGCSLWGRTESDTTEVT